MTLIPFDLALKENVSTIFYIYSYEAELDRIKEQQLKKMQARH